MTNPYLNQEREDYIDALRHLSGTMQTIKDHPDYALDLNQLHQTLQEYYEQQCFDILSEMQNNPERYNDYLQNNTNANGELITPLKDMPEKLNNVVKQYILFSYGRGHDEYLCALQDHTPTCFEQSNNLTLVENHITTNYLEPNIAINNILTDAQISIGAAIAKESDDKNIQDKGYTVLSTYADELRTFIQREAIEENSITKEKGCLYFLLNKEAFKSDIDIITKPWKDGFSPIVLQNYSSFVIESGGLKEALNGKVFAIKPENSGGKFPS